MPPVPVPNDNIIAPSPTPVPAIPSLTRIAPVVTELTVRTDPLIDALKTHAGVGAFAGSSILRIIG